MKHPNPSHDILELAQLERLFDAPRDVSLAKEIDHIDANYAQWIAASPFCVLGTAGPAGLDSSPRGDAPGFVHVLDPKTLLIPDRRGNNRIDSFRNLMSDPRVSLLFLIPGLGETLRVNGRARINADPNVCASLAVNGKVPRLILVVHVQEVYFQCSRAIVRSRLWDPTVQVGKAALPTPGKILADISQGRLGGETYDRELPERVKTTLY